MLINYKTKHFLFVTEPFNYFHMAVLNDLDRFHLVGNVIDRVESLGSRAAYVKQFLRDKLLDHKAYIEKHGEDMSEILDWKWQDE